MPLPIRYNHEYTNFYTEFSKGVRMSASRLLILGVLRFKQPAHGYEIRRELESWGAEQWANIAYGSIYHALSKMGEEGLLKPVETERVNNKPARTSYAVTETGEQEFQRLLREFWWEYKPVIDPFQVALTFMNAMPQDELLSALRYRANLYRSAVEGFEYGIRSKAMAGAPRHIAENLRLVVVQCEAAAEWAEQAIEKVERGELP